jgi:hypothetical protein
MNIDIPAWWARQSDEHRVVIAIVGIVGFLLALLFLPPLLVLAGVGAIAYGVLSHAYRCFHNQSEWTSPEGLYSFSVFAGVLSIALGGFISWVL